MNDGIVRWLLIYPAFFIRGERYLHYYKEAVRVDKMSIKEIDDYQKKKIESLLTHCLKNNIYYSKIIHKITSEKNINEYYEIFQQMPLLTKDIIRNKMLEQKPQWKKRLDKRTTSGSTGMPLMFYKDRNATAAMEAAQNLAFSWHNILLGEAQARFWGMPAGRGKIIATLKDTIKNRYRFSAFELSDYAKKNYVQKIKKKCPTHIYGYPSLVKEFGDFLKKNNLNLSDIPLKKIIVTGEYLSEYERKKMEDIFSMPFVNEYGCSETGVIGFECPYNNMHVMSSNIKIEIVDENCKSLPFGTEGEIVVTELNEKNFPFIRYRIGDRGKLIRDHKCLCGRRSPLIEIVQGRTKNFILTPEGNKVYDAILAYTLKKGIYQFKAVQTDIDLICIYIVPDSNFHSSYLEKYENILKQKISPRVKIKFKTVTSIDRNPSGKLTYFESKILN